MIWRAASRVARLDDALAAYGSAVVSATLSTPRVESGSLHAHSASRLPSLVSAAADRKERAATTYARLMRRVRHLAQAALGHQPASMQPLLGAW
jgi:hypothetical protein